MEAVLKPRPLEDAAVGLLEASRALDFPRRFGVATRPLEGASSTSTDLEIGGLLEASLALDFLRRAGMMPR